MCTAGDEKWWFRCNTGRGVNDSQTSYSHSNRQRVIVCLLGLTGDTPGETPYWAAVHLPSVSMSGLEAQTALTPVCISDLRLSFGIPPRGLTCTSRFSRYISMTTTHCYRYTAKAFKPNGITHIPAHYSTPLLQMKCKRYSCRQHLGAWIRTLTKGYRQVLWWCLCIFCQCSHFIRRRQN